MALSLSAEQKSLMRIFFNEDRFIIPDYQRPYSWGYDECLQLFTDITSAYLDDSQDYFLGNIIMARASEESDTDANIVDGQQRLITIWMLLKCMALLLPDIKKIQKALSTEPWDADEQVPKIISKEEDFQSSMKIKTIWSIDKKQTEQLLAKYTEFGGKIDDKVIDDRYLTNFLNLYLLMSKFLGSMQPDHQNLFWNFFINKVFLLPIELQGKTMLEAEDKAMTIFETINNRGLDLRDADIFKSRLYKKAKSENKQDEFIELWYEFTADCDKLGVSVDDVFRYYMHIVRGKNKITDMEKSLRDFFFNESFSPIRKMEYNIVLEDLLKITQIIQTLQVELTQDSELCQWLQILHEYSNNYPRYALVTYIYVNGFENKKGIVAFLKKILRYCYSCGATRSVKFEIYNIIKNLFNGSIVSDYTFVISNQSSFPYVGMLKNGFALLAYYLGHPNKVLKKYYIDRLIKDSDKNYLKEWNPMSVEDAMNNVANYVVLDIPPKRIPLNKKNSHYSTSEIEEVRNLLDSNSNISEAKFICRRDNLKKLLIHFFEA